MSAEPTDARGAALREVVLVFLRLGATAFGGPAAHIALMEDELVSRRRWVSRQRFLDLLGGTNLIPGPNSTEMAMHLGRERAGWPGLVLGGAAFILPAFLLVLGLAALYRRYGALPRAEVALYGIKPVIIAVIAQAVWVLGRSAIKNRGLALLAAAATAAAALGVHELLVIFGAGILALAPLLARRHPPGAAALGPVASPGALLATGSAAPVAAGGPAGLVAAGVAVGSLGPAAATGAVGLLPLFLVFLKIGAVLFGSGYVLVAFLRADLVQRLGWLSETQLLDAVAVGQMTPGPVSTTATFIGYLLGGAPAAAVATTGIFLPAFVFVAASAPLLARMRGSAAAGAFLDGVNVGSLAAIALVSWQLGRAAIVDPLTAIIAGVSLVLLLWRRVSSLPLIIAGAAASLLRHALMG